MFQFFLVQDNAGSVRARWENFKDLFWFFVLILLRRILPCIVPDWSHNESKFREGYSLKIYFSNIVFGSFLDPNPNSKSPNESWIHPSLPSSTCCCWSSGTTWPCCCCCWLCRWCCWWWSWVAAVAVGTMPTVMITISRRGRRRSELLLIDDVLDTPNLGGWAIEQFRRKTKGEQWRNILGAKISKFFIAKNGKIYTKNRVKI